MKPIKDGELKNLELGATFDYDPSDPLPDDLKEMQKEYEAFQDENQKHKHVYAVAGLALYWAQCFETELQSLYLLVKKAKGELPRSEDHDALEGVLAKATLGALLRKVSDVATVDEKGMNLLEKALDSRNSLVHGFFWLHVEDHATDAGQRRILDDLLKRILLFRMANNLASLATKAILKAYGVTEDQLEAEFEEWLAYVRKGG